MSMEQNQLTQDLYAAGYTREDHPLLRVLERLAEFRLPL